MAKGMGTKWSPMSTESPHRKSRLIADGFQCSVYYVPSSLVILLLPLGTTTKWRNRNSTLFIGEETGSQMVSLTYKLKSS